MKVFTVRTGDEGEILGTFSSLELAQKWVDDTENANMLWKYNQVAEDWASLGDELWIQQWELDPNP